MKRMYIRILSLVLPFFVIWLFVIALKNDFDLSDVRINLYATVKQFENVGSSDDLYAILKGLIANFTNLNYDYSSSYVEINDLTSFFSNVGTWFNLTFKNFTTYFVSMGTVIKSIVSLFVYLFNLILNIFNLIFNPVTY